MMTDDGSSAIAQVEQWMEIVRGKDTSEDETPPDAEKIVQMGLPIVPLLLSYLEKGDGAQRDAAQLVPFNMGDIAMPAVVDALEHHDNPAVRERCIRILQGPAVRGDAKGSDVVAAIVRALDDSDDFIVTSAMSVFTSIAENDKDRAATAIPTLMRHLKHDDEMVRHDAITALSSLGHRAMDAVPALKELAETDTEFIREDAKSTMDYILRLSSGEQA